MRRLQSPSHQRRRRRSWLIVVVVAIVALAVASLRVGPPPTVKVTSALEGVGPRRLVGIVVEEPVRGVGDVAVVLEQGEQRWPLAEVHHRSRPAWSIFGRRQAQVSLEVEIGHAVQQALTEGPASLAVEASRAGAWLRRPAAVVERFSFAVDRTPPAVTVLSPHVYVTQGGCEAVVYRVDAEATRHGVVVDDWWFPGSSLGDGRSFALFAAPWNVAEGDLLRLVAEDEVGNRSERPFVDRFTPRPPRRESIELDDAFFERVVPPILDRNPDLPAGDRLLQGFLAINGELRERNRATLRELLADSPTRFLWRRPFLSLPGSKVMSAFATERTYRYRGEVVDEQVHLGYDQASVRRAQVPAANDGVVRWAGDMGIYGNVVILDHGYGLGSLYAHLSEIAVEVGDTVERGVSLGSTGQTGLAGGDHLHFATLLRGLPVDALEWWDAHWLRDRLAAKLGPAFELEER